MLVLYPHGLVSLLEFSISYLILSYLILSYLILSYLILSYRILSYLILSYLILSYLILSYLILSYLILSYLISWFEGTDHHPTALTKFVSTIIWSSSLIRQLIAAAQVNDRNLLLFDWAIHKLGVGRCYGTCHFDKKKCVNPFEVDAACYFNAEVVKITCVT